MFVIIWIIGKDLQVHYQRNINPAKGVAEWAWGPADGAFLVPISEAVALIMINRADAQMEVHANG
jgi:hypothetical protein